jgi:hypothetical protein
MLRAVVVTAVIGTALFVLQPTQASGNDPVLGIEPPAPLIGPQEGPTAPISAAVACTKTMTVLIQVHQFFSEPTSNGCWGYNRVRQNAGQGSGTWKICKADGSVIGDIFAPNAVFDDTNPANPLASETNYIDICDSVIYGEDMARRSSPEQWCALNTANGGPCWRRNAANVTVQRYFAELYSDDCCVDDYKSAWQQSGWGAYPGNSWALYNIRPLVFNHQFSTFPLFNLITTACNETPNGGYYSIYAGIATGDLTTSQTDVDTFSSAMNSCTT